MDRFVIRQTCLLLLTAFIWGIAFVAQSAGMDYVGPFTFNAVRCLIGGVTLIPVIGIMKIHRTKKGNELKSRGELKSLFLGGAICGLLLFIASNFQQFGIQYTTVGKAGFVTALYIILVPIFGIFLHRRAGMQVWCGVLLALCGLYLLCMKDSLQLSKGDAMVLVCAFTFSFHILTVDHFSPKVDGVKMSCVQFFVCGILSGICMIVFERPNVMQILAAWLPILYAGVMSCGVAYTLQIVGQEGMNPTIASLIMSLESVVSVLAGWILLHEKLSRRELAGCLLMFIAIVLAQLPERKKKETVLPSVDP